MTTPLMFQGGDKFTKVCKLTGHELPIVWDVKQQKLYSRKIRELYVYQIIMVFIVLLLCLGPTILKTFLLILTTKAKEYDSILLHVLAIVLCFIGYGGGICFAVLAAKYAEEVVAAINALLRFEALVRYAAHWKRRKTSGFSGADIVGYILNILPFLPITLCPWVCAFAVYKKLDSFYTVLELVIPAKILEMFFIKIVLFILRFLAILIGAVESLNTIIGVAFMVIMAARGINDSVRLLEQYYLKLAKRSAMLVVLNMKYIHLYNNLVMCMQILSDASSSVAFYLLGGSMLFCVQALYASINFYNLLPIYLYVMCPFSVCLIIAASLVGLPLAVVIDEVTTRMLHTWKYNTKSIVGQKYMRRRIAAMRPVRFYAGPLDYNIFPVTISTKANYYRAILDYTCTLLLAVPIHN